jgi:hypothetical protein
MSRLALSLPLLRFQRITAAIVFFRQQDIPIVAVLKRLDWLAPLFSQDQVMPLLLHSAFGLFQFL